MSEGRVRLERRDHVVILTLDRPERKNALSQGLWQALAETLDELRNDPARAIILTGAGGAFCAGMDVRPDNPQLAVFQQAMAGASRGPIRDLLVRLKSILTALEELPMPTIAAIGGVAYGAGAEMVLCCDLRVMDAAATMCFSETRLGLMPDVGGTVRLLRQLGRARALDLICTARDLRADEALALGLVNRVAPPGHSLAVALDLAALIAQNGPGAVRAAKRAARAAESLPVEQAMAAETEAAVDCILSGECIEGISAWMQRRPARFA